MIGAVGRPVAFLIAVVTGTNIAGRAISAHVASYQMESDWIVACKWKRPTLTAIATLDAVHISGLSAVTSFVTRLFAVTAAAAALDARLRTTGTGS